MKIAHVITALSLGGAEQVVEDLSIACCGKGVTSHVIALAAPDPALADFSAAMRMRLDRADIPVHDLAAPDKRLGLLTRLPALAALLARERFDLVHAHVDHAEFALSLVGRVRRLRKARTIHNTVLWPGHPRLARISETGWRDDLVIAVSPVAMDAHVALRQSLGLRSSSHRQVILNGVPTVEGGDAIHHDGPLKLAFFGRSTPQKGLDILIEALRLIPSDAPPFSLKIHSDAALDPGFRQQLRDLAPVTLVPPVTDARARLADFDLVVMPSRFEGLPLVAIEALAAGTPLLATDAPGLGDILPPNWPLTVPREDAAALAGRLVAAAGQVGMIRTLRSRAAAHGRQFAIGTTADRYIAAYRTYLDGVEAPQLYPR